MYACEFACKPGRRNPNAVSDTGCPALAPAPLADNAAREHAIDLRRSFIVQAPAGSGKTELLVLRYLKLLAHVAFPEEIIAITFTRKAAAEMRERIMLALHQSAAVTVPLEMHDRKRLRLAQDALAQNEKRGWELLQNPERLRVQTIDAFCASLTRQMPVLSGFGATRETMDDASRVYREAAENTLREMDTHDQWTPALERLILHLNNDLPKLAGMLESMLARRDQWLRHSGYSRDRHALEQSLQREIGGILAQVKQVLPERLLPQMLALARYAGANVRRSEPEICIAACADLESLPETPAQWQGLATLLLTRDGAWRKVHDVRTGFPAPSSAACADPERLRLMKTRMRELMDELAPHTDFRHQLSRLFSLPPCDYTDLQWSVLQALFEILHLATAHLKVLFQSYGQVDFIEVSQAALQALGEHSAPTDLALALDYRIAHLLVDEFQDTSFNQFELLQRVTTGWEAGDGRTLFLVGDPMQSIYRFREAEVGLFVQVSKARQLGHVPVTPLRLSVNLRAQRNIVEWSNTTFRGVFPAYDSVSDGAVAYAASTGIRDNAVADAVVVHPYFEPSDFAEAVTIKDIAEAAAAADLSVAILARSRLHLTEIVRQLRLYGVGFTAVDIESLAARPVILDLLALTAAIIHLADRIAWLSLLRAPWCGLLLSDLYQLAGNTGERTIWELMNEPERVRCLSADGRRRLLRVREVLRPVLAGRRRRSLARAVESAWLHLGGPATALEEHDLQSAAVFFRCLCELGTGGDIVEIERLYTETARLFAAPDPTPGSSLQLMTIHKAKGLEFDVVILPGLGKCTQAPERELLHWLERPREDGSGDLLLAMREPVGGSYDPIYEYIKDIDREKSHLEAARLLYVAATRARKQLHLFGHVNTDDTPGRAAEPKAPAKGSLLALLWPALEPIYRRRRRDACDAAPSRDAIPAPAIFDIERLTENWQLPAPPPDVQPAGVDDDETEVREDIDFLWVGGALRHIGTVVHRLLHSIGEDGIRAWGPVRVAQCRPMIRSNLAGLGVEPDRLDDACERVIEALTSTLGDARGRWVFAPSHTEVHNEYALTGVLQDSIINVIIDRTFVDAGGTRWIVDYKTSSHSGADLDAFLDNEKRRYREQMENYARLIACLDRRPIRIGLYFPLLLGWREWVPYPGTWTPADSAHESG